MLRSTLQKKKREPVSRGGACPCIKPAHLYVRQCTVIIWVLTFRQMNESADKGYGVSNRFVDPAEGPCTHVRAIREEKTSFMFENSYEEPSHFLQ